MKCACRRAVWRLPSRRKTRGYVAEIIGPVAAHDGLRPAPRANLHVFQRRVTLPVCIRAELHDCERLPANVQIVVSFGITNSGTRAGDEVVKFYVKHSDAKWRGPTKN
jgi:hypothetical protein